MAEPNDRFGPGLSPGPGYGGQAKYPSGKKALLNRYKESTIGQQQPDSDVPSPNPSIISDCPELSSPETALSFSSLRSPESFPQVKSAESCDTTVSIESASESLGSEANGGNASLTSPNLLSRSIKRPQPRRRRDFPETVMTEEKDSDMALLGHRSVCQTATSSAICDSRRTSSFCHPDARNKELFTSHWAERVAAHHRDNSADASIRNTDPSLQRRVGQLNQLNHCVDEDPFLQEVLYRGKHFAHNRSHELAYDSHLGELQALRERLVFEHMIKGGNPPVDNPIDRYMPDQHFSKCPENVDRMPMPNDASNVFARVAMEQEMEAERRRSVSKARSAERLSSSSSADLYPNPLLDLSMSHQKRQRLDNESSSSYKLEPSSSPVSSSNQADELPHQVPFIGPSGLKMDDQQQHLCQVCGDVAAGFHCGAYVCEACKKFFVRCLKQDAGMKFVCPRNNQCDITKDTRTQCQRCRYRKCLALGMYKPGGANISSEICHIPCSVCGAPSSGFHFGAITCEGCKGFFRRTIKERDILKYQCSREGTCIITTATRNICKFCRYQKCLDAGMKADGSRIGRQPNAIKHATMMQLKQIKSSLGLDTKNLPVKNMMLKHEPEMDKAYGQHPTDHSPNSQTTQPSFQPSPSQPDYHDNLMSSLPSLEPMIPRRQSSPQLSSPLLNPSPTDQHLSPQQMNPSSQRMHPPPPQMNSSPPGVHPPPPQMNSSPQGLHPSPPQMNSSPPGLHLPPPQMNSSPPGMHSSPPQMNSSPPGVHPPPSQMNSSPHLAETLSLQIGDMQEAISDLDVFNSESCDIFSQTLNLDPPIGLFNEEKFGYMGTPPTPSNRPVAFTHAPAKPASPKVDPPTAQPNSKPKDPASDGELPDVDAILLAMEKATPELDQIRKRCDNPFLTDESDAATIWGLQMEQFKQSAVATLRFSKKIPGFRQMQMSTQIGTLQSCMFPIVMLQLARDYDVATQVYNYFNFQRAEVEHILKSFEPFECLIEPFHYIGAGIKELDMTPFEIGLLSAIHIMSEAKNKAYESLLVRALMEHEQRRGLGMERHGLILLRLGDLVRANLAHQKSVIDIMSQPEKYSSLEIPQLFQETFFNSV